MLTNQQKPSKTNQQGFTLVEFIISMALSLAAILVVTSIYIVSFQIDSKAIKYARLNDEVTSIMALLSEDIKRAGYVANAELTISSATPAGNIPPFKCNPDPSICAPVEFRTLLVDNFAGEVDNSCILFAYDFNDNNGYDSPGEAFGYRLNDGELEVRQRAGSCTDGNWQALTDIGFVTISGLTFTCKVSDDGDTDNYETDTVTVAGVTTTTNIELNCAAGNLPYVGIYNGTVTVDISFTATLVDDSDISLTASEKVLVRNASYD